MTSTCKESVDSKALSDFFLRYRRHFLALRAVTWTNSCQHFIVFWAAANFDLCLSPKQENKTVHYNALLPSA